MCLCVYRPPMMYGLVTKQPVSSCLSLSLTFIYLLLFSSKFRTKNHTCKSRARQQHSLSSSILSGSPFFAETHFIFLFVCVCVLLGDVFVAVKTHRPNVCGMNFLFRALHFSPHFHLPPTLLLRLRHRHSFFSPFSRLKCFHYEIKKCVCSTC